MPTAFPLAPPRCPAPPAGLLGRARCCTAPPANQLLSSTKHLAARPHAAHVAPLPPPPERERGVASHLNLPPHAQAPIYPPPPPSPAGPFSHRVLLLLEEREVPYARTYVDAAHKPAW